MATAKAMTWEMMISSRSMGKPVATMWDTDSWVRYDWPRLPWKTWVSQIQYWW